MEYFTHNLSNGMRLVHLPSDTTVSYFGLLVNTGSRDESDEEHGIAHFIEHVIFKGTKHRKAYHILSRLDDVGGEINAYTTKEETAFYAGFLNHHYDRAMELISDIVFNSVFPFNELEREREVIADEINSYNDNPSDLIFDDYEELIFAGHPISRNILGTPSTIDTFDQAAIRRFMARTYNTEEMVLCSVGKIPLAQLIKLADKYFSWVETNNRRFIRKPFQNYNATTRVIDKGTHQAHCIIGNLAYNALDHKRMNLVLLNNLLGGQGLNSRLNLSLREKHGYAYNVESSFTPYVDTGVLTIYFGTDHEKLAKSIKLVNKELDLLRTRKLGILQLRRAKNQIMGQIAMSADNKENLLFTLGKSILLFNKFDSMETVNRRIEAITAEELLETSNEVFDPSMLSTLIFQ
ncbi:MAG: pitrilysin family protein [Bacteroidales bacterium]|nr:pitrilysin family protein [Bacteroidales bacterium]NLO69179.1 insulinase family protein [Bacteroidales bacterium]